MRIKHKYYETGEEEYNHPNRGMVGNCVRCKTYTWLDPHHRVKRRYDKNDETIVHLCRKCHTHVELHPAVAKAEGFYITKHTNGDKNFKKTDLGSFREQV